MVFVAQLIVINRICSSRWLTLIKRFHGNLNSTSALVELASRAMKTVCVCYPGKHFVEIEIKACKRVWWSRTGAVWRYSAMNFTNY